MKLFDLVINLLKGESIEKDIPEGYCPNCWGRQEYAGGFQEALRNEQIDLNNVEEKRGWIQAYATNKFEGIKLRKVDAQSRCPSCQLDFTQSE